MRDESDQAQTRVSAELRPGDLVEGEIFNITDFGAFVELGGRSGLIHISDLSWSHINHPSEAVEIGERVTAKVLDVDRVRHRVSLGLKQTQPDPVAEFIRAHSVGELVTGKLTKLVSFGIFVELAEGVEGMAHISELSAGAISSPAEVVELGEELTAEIIKIDEDRGIIKLSLRPLRRGSL